MPFQNLFKDNPIKIAEKAGVKKGEKLKGKVSPSKEDLSQMHAGPTGSDEEILEEELDAYIEEGENAGGEFPINKDLTLRQDVLANHLAELRVSILISNFLCYLEGTAL